MTTLFDSRLSDRDFASHLLHVDDLLTWAKSKRLHLRTTPPIDKSEFVQVEALLCAIQRHANNLTPEQALSIVLNDPVLKNDPVFQKYPDDIDPSTCRWLLGAEAHRKWRELLSGAIAAHELELLDFGSKLPIQTAPAKTAATPAPVVATDASGDEVTAPNWRMQIQAEAYELWLRFRANGCNPSVHSICEDMAVWCITKNIKGGKGQNPRAGTIRNTVLGAGHWTPPHHSVEQAKKHVEQIARTAQTQVAQIAQWCAKS